MPLDRVHWVRRRTPPRGQDPRVLLHGFRNAGPCAAGDLRRRSELINVCADAVKQAHAVAKGGDRLAAISRATVPKRCRDIVGRGAIPLFVERGERELSFCVAPFGSLFHEAKGCFGLALPAFPFEHHQRQAVRPIGTAHRRRAFKRIRRKLRVLRHAAAGEKHHAKAALRTRIALIGREGVPARRSFWVRFNAAGLFV